MSSQAVRVDRRAVRRRETIEEVVDHAVDVMAEQGVAGLSLSEVARRMGMRTPSLYGYFDSKHAVYDAVFARGWTELGRVIASLGPPPSGGDLADYLLESGTVFLRWHIEHPVHAQLMAWRPVPGYVPSPEAYAPAVQVYEEGTELFGRLRELGLLRSDVPPAEALRSWTVLISGVMTQQLANAPDEPFDAGRFTTTFPELVRMYLAHYGTSTSTATT